MLFAVCALGCSKTESGPGPDNEGPNVDADYSVLLSHDGLLSETLLNANAEIITLNPSGSQFESSTLPEQRYRDGNELSFYTTKGDCTGELSKVDFNTYAARRVSVFEDLSNCELEVTALAHSDTNIFVAYTVPGTGAKETHSFVRTVAISEEETSFTDLELQQQALQLIYVSGKLFVLSKDAAEDDKYALVVIDTNEGLPLHEVNLDFNVQKIFKTISGNIMVSYPELHLVVSSSSMGIIETVRYNEGKEPKFGYTDASFFDASGNLYYTMPTDQPESEYDNIPGVYDFSTNTAVLYFYENFLTATQRQFEYKIGDTSMVSYDAANNLILIGYQKADDPDKGGLLRIRPIPEPAFIDNTDLDGVPREFFVN